MLVFGRRLYGRILKCDESCVATWFLHVWFVPIIPAGSVLVLAPLPGDQLRVVKTDLNLRSIGVAYLRGWSVFLLLHGLFNIVEADPDGSALYGPAVAAVAVLGIILGFFVLGRTSDETRARHEVYRSVFGYPVDLALLGPSGDAFAAALRERIAVLGRNTAASYRAMLDPVTRWGDIALDPMTTDREFLACAMSLARLERGRATGPARDAFDGLHDQIWARLRALGPAPAPAWQPPAQHP